MSREKAPILEEQGAMLKDGLENLIASLGNEQDKRSYSRYVNSKRLSQDGNQHELNALYRTNWVAGKIIDILPDDMTREWREFSGEISPDIIDALVEEEERLDLRGNFNQAHKWARLYGTSFIIMAIDDGQTPDKPLNINNIRTGSLQHIKVVDRHRMDRGDIEPITDPFNPAYGFPLYYRVVETSIRIHHSRVIRFDAVKLPFDELRRNNYMSDSVLDRLYESITNVDTAANSSASMIYENTVDVIKVKGLMNYLISKQGEDTLRKRFSLAKLLKSFNNMLLLDQEEDYVRQNQTYAGLPDLIDKYLFIVSAAADVPATRFLGSSASGLNATGEGDKENYSDHVSSKQISEYKPKLDLFDIIMAKNLGLNLTNKQLKYKFCSLSKASDSEIAEIENKNAQRDSAYLDRGVINEYIVAAELKQKGTYTNITDDYLEELKQYIEEKEELQEEMMSEINTNPDEEIATAEQENEGGEKEKTNPSN